MPISSCGLRLNNEAVRVAVSLRLGSALCQLYKCICGASVDTRGSHALSCRRNPERSLRRRPDLALLVEGRLPLHKGTTRPSQIRRETPWRPNSHPMARRTLYHVGCHSHWHRGGVLFECNVLHSGLSGRSRGLTEGGEERCNFIKLSLFPLAFETFGPINQAGRDFLSPLGHRLPLVSDDPRESSFLFQRLYVSFQRFNSVSAIHSGTC